MKRAFFLLVISFLITSSPAQKADVKTGWKFGAALPAVTFDSDLGFQYGGLVEFFNYGDGSTYPDYFDHTYTEISHYTKGSGIYRFMFESNHIIPGVHLTTDISYLPDQGYHFYDLHEGEHVSELLDYVHINSEDLKTAYREKLANSDLSEQQRQDYERELIAGLTSYTYLEK